jgi:protein-S-isoprenylcysteine O-methyltransferase Ste14
MDTPRSGLSRDTIQSIALDAFERLVVVLLFGRFAFKMLAAPGREVDFVTVLLLVSEILPVIFILSRPRSDAVSRKLSDWLLGISGAIIPLLVTPTGPGSLVPLSVCAVIMLTGLYLQISAKVSLGQSFGLVAANRGVRVIGPYRFVRHPMYAGYMIAHIGFWLAFPSLWNTAFYAAEFAIQVARLLREERFLRQDQAYRAYAARVRYRLLPAIF